MDAPNTRDLLAETDDLRRELASLRSALAIERERAEKAETRAEAAEEWRGQFDCCMCGSMMDAHDIGSGHAPVSMYDYERSMLAQRAESAEASLAEARALMKPFAGVLPKTSAHVAIDRFLAPKGGPDHG